MEHVGNFTAHGWNFITDFKLHKIWLHLADIWGFVYCPSCVHVFTCCVRTCACAHPWTLSISSGDQSWHMLKDLWGSVYIWLTYEGLYIAQVACIFSPTVHARMHLHTHEHYNQLSRLILTYTEIFMKIWLQLAEIWGFVYCPKLHTCFHTLCVHLCTCTFTIFLTNSGDQSWNMLKISWRSDFI